MIINDRTILNNVVLESGISAGYQVIIEPGVKIGDRVKLGNRVTLRSGTIIGDDSIIDDNCITTGACYIGKKVNVRTGTIISMGTIIEDLCFIGPGVVTNHTLHVNYGREHKTKRVQLLTYIGFGSIIGSQASIVAGVWIYPQTIIGAGAVVTKDIILRGVYVGVPARFKSLVKGKYVIDQPENTGSMYLTNEILSHLKSYIPDLDIRENRLRMHSYFNPIDVIECCRGIE